MLILNSDNQTIDTSEMKTQENIAILRMKPVTDPDIYFDTLTCLEEFKSPTVVLQIGDSAQLYLPFHWSILCSDHEYVQSIPIFDFLGRQFNAFSINPISGFLPSCPQIRLVEVLSDSQWIVPCLGNKDMVAVPFMDNGRVDTGPECVFVSPNKIDNPVHISDIV